MLSKVLFEITPPPIFGIWTIFLPPPPPKFDHVCHFIRILLGSYNKSPPFSACRRSFCPPKLTKSINHFIQILLGPIFNFERRTPTDFYPECPHPPTPTPPGNNNTTDLVGGGGGVGEGGGWIVVLWLYIRYMIFIV